MNELEVAIEYLRARHLMLASLPRYHGELQSKSNDAKRDA